MRKLDVQKYHRNKNRNITAKTKIPSITSNNENLPVVPEEIIDEKSPLWCPIHLGLLHIPVMSSKCGHSYCKNCIEKWQQSNGRCPICRVNFDTLIPNLIAQHILNILLIHCRYGLFQDTNGNWIIDSNGCKEIIENENRQIHESNCTYAYVNCPNNQEGCGKIKKRDLEEHHKTCPFNLITKQEDIIKLNVGGRLFMTSRRTLSKYPSKLKTICQNENIPKDQNGAIFIDWDPNRFEKMLNYIRMGKISNLFMMKEELKFFSLNLKEESPSFSISNNNKLPRINEVFSAFSIPPKNNKLPRIDGIYYGAIENRHCSNQHAFSHIIVIFSKSLKIMHCFHTWQDNRYPVSRFRFISPGEIKISIFEDGTIAVPELKNRFMQAEWVGKQCRTTVQSIMVRDNNSIMIGGTILSFCPYKSPCVGMTYSGNIFSQKSVYGEEFQFSFTKSNWTINEETYEIKLEEKKEYNGENYKGFCFGHFFLLKRPKCRSNPQNPKEDFIYHNFDLLYAIIPEK